MSTKFLNLKIKILIGTVGIVIILLFFNLFINQIVLGHAINKNEASSLKIMADILSQSLVTAMEFEDEESVKTTLSPVVSNPHFTYVSVQRNSGEEIFHFRRNGYSLNPQIPEEGVLENPEEVLINVPIKGESNTFGRLILGLSLKNKTWIIHKAQMVMLLGAIITLIIFSIFSILLARDIAVPIRKLKYVARELGNGELVETVEIKRSDEIGELATAFNKMIEALRNKFNLVNELANGNLDVHLDLASEHDVLGNAMINMKMNLKSLTRSIREMYDAHKSGEYQAQLDEKKFQGVYRDVCHQVNEITEFYVENMMEMLQTLRDYANGNFKKEMRNFPGRLSVINKEVLQIKSNLEFLVEEVLRLTREAQQGHLDSRGDVHKFKGRYQEIIQGINQLITAMHTPLKEAMEVFEKLAQGDFTVRITGTYQGETAQFKETLNHTLARIGNSLGQMSFAINQFIAGAQQVADSAQSVSQGATEQASSLEEIASSMTEIVSQTEQNSQYANKANSLSMEARNAAEDGNSLMKDLLEAIDEIEQSSEKISKIIKVIDEIAFQTNLLALNAAVEAARAGVHGKGFAVVAEEVRNLAQRSARAAKETTELIEGTVERVNNGTRIAQVTASSLKNIIQSISQVSDLVKEINTASQNQVTSINEINQALEQIDKITQNNAANAEESASAAEELFAQAQEIKKILNYFKIEHHTKLPHSIENAPGFTWEVLKKQNQPAKHNGSNGNGEMQKDNFIEGDDRLILLDDDDFGEF